MTDSASDTATLSNALTLFVVALIASVVLITFGGFVRSLTLVGVGTVVLLGTLGWAELSEQTNSGVVITLLPWIAAIYIVTAGLYLDSDLLWWSGFALLIVHMAWTNRSEFKRLIARFHGENND